MDIYIYVLSVVLVFGVPLWQFYRSRIKETGEINGYVTPDEIRDSVVHIRAKHWDDVSRGTGFVVGDSNDRQIMTCHHVLFKEGRRGWKEPKSLEIWFEQNAGDSRRWSKLSWDTLDIVCQDKALDAVVFRVPSVEGMQWNEVSDITPFKEGEQSYHDFLEANSSPVGEFKWPKPFRLSRTVAKGLKLSLWGLASGEVQGLKYDDYWLKEHDAELSADSVGSGRSELLMEQINYDWQGASGGPLILKHGTTERDESVVVGMFCSSFADGFGNPTGNPAYSTDWFDWINVASRQDRFVHSITELPVAITQEESDRLSRIPIEVWLIVLIVDVALAYLFANRWSATVPLSMLFLLALAFFSAKSNTASKTLTKLTLILSDLTAANLLVEVRELIVYIWGGYLNMRGLSKSNYWRPIVVAMIVNFVHVSIFVLMHGSTYPKQQTILWGICAWLAFSFVDVTSFQITLRMLNTAIRGPKRRLGKRAMLLWRLLFIILDLVVIALYLVASCSFIAGVNYVYHETYKKRAFENLPALFNDPVVILSHAVDHLNLIFEGSVAYSNSMGSHYPGLIIVGLLALSTATLPSLIILLVIPLWVVEGGLGRFVHYVGRLINEPRIIVNDLRGSTGVPLDHRNHIPWLFPSIALFFTVYVVFVISSSTWEFIHSNPSESDINFVSLPGREDGSNLMVSSTLVTQSQWSTVLTRARSMDALSNLDEWTFDKAPWLYIGDSLPVHNLDICDAMRFSNILSIVNGLKPYYGPNPDLPQCGIKPIHKNLESNGYRLPNRTESIALMRLGDDVKLSGKPSKLFFASDHVSYRRGEVNFWSFDEYSSGGIHGTTFSTGFVLDDMISIYKRNKLRTASLKPQTGLFVIKGRGATLPQYVDQGTRLRESRHVYFAMKRSGAIVETNSTSKNDRKLSDVVMYEVMTPFETNLKVNGIAVNEHTRFGGVNWTYLFLKETDSSCLVSFDKMGDIHSYEIKTPISDEPGTGPRGIKQINLLKSEKQKEKEREKKRQRGQYVPRSNGDCLAFSDGKWKVVEKKSLPYDIRRQ